MEATKCSVIFKQTAIAWPAGRERSCNDGPGNPVFNGFPWDDTAFRRTKLVRNRKPVED